MQMGNIRTGTKLALYTSTFLIMYSILGFNTVFFCLRKDWTENTVQL